MPWDMMCCQCSAMLVGDMVEDEQGTKDSQAEYDGAIIYCSYCDIYIDFTSGDVIDIISYLRDLFTKGKLYEVKIINGG